MAQTHNATHDAGAASKGSPNGSASPDQAAWLAECKAIKCRTDAGETWAYSGGKLFTVPSPAGFADMPAPTRRLVAMMAMQFLPTRVGQNATGDVSVEIAKAVNDPATYFSTQKDKDAFEAAYGDGIADLVDAAKGWSDPTKPLSKEEKAARAELISKSAERQGNRDKYFQPMVTAAIEAGRNVTGKEKKRVAKVASDGGMEL